MRPVLAAFLALALAAAVAVDELRPAGVSGPPQRTVVAAGGTLACPIARTAIGRAYISVANVGPGTSTVRLTLIPDRGRAVGIRFRLRDGDATSIATHRRIRPPASAMIEYAGGRIVASHVASERGARGGAMGAPCAPPTEDTLVVPLGSTQKARTTLVLFNPGEGDAVVGVQLLAGRRLVAPERLRERVVPAHGRMEIALGDFVFDQPSVAAVVRMRVGRVVAESLLRTPNGPEFVPATVPRLRGGLVIPTGAAGATLQAFALGDEPATVDAQRVTARNRVRAGELPPDLAAGVVVRRAVRGARDQPVSYSYDVRAGSPVVLAAGWRDEAGVGTDFSTSVAARPSRMWAAVATVPDGKRRSMRFYVVNPGRVTAAVRVRFLGGDREIRSLTVPAGRLTSELLLDGPGTRGVEIRSDRAVLVGIRGFGAVPGLFSFAGTAEPLDPPPRVSVVHDPTAALPAIIRRR